MTQSFITIEGQTYDPSALTLPASREFRDFWTVNGTVVEVDTAAALAAKRAEAVIGRGPFALAAATEGWITDAEALAWAGGQAIPGWVDALIDTAAPASERLRLKIEVLTNTHFPRLGLLMPLLQDAPQTNGTATDEKIDEIYGISVPT